MLNLTFMTMNVNVVMKMIVTAVSMMRDNPFYEVTCSACGQKINVSEDVLLEGEIECPNCGELLEFDFSDLFDEDGHCAGGCSCDNCTRRR